MVWSGNSWGQRNTRYSDQRWIAWARTVTAHQGVLKLDMGPNYDPKVGPVGQLAPAQVLQVKALKAALRGAENSEKRGGESKLERQP